MNKKLLSRDFIIFIITLIIVTIFFIWQYYDHTQEKDEIDSNLKTTYGKIVRNYKQANSSWGVKILYKANRKCYLRGFSSTFWCQNEECLGDSIKIEYSAVNPNNSRAVRKNGEVLYPAMKLGEQNYRINCDTTFND